MPKLSVVTPTYKAERILPELYRRLRIVLETITEDFEIIIVNDHSPQDDWEVIKKLSRIDPRVKGIDLSRNFGQHFAITAALDNVSGDWTIVMDCDLQDRPEEIPKLYNKAIEGYDVVFGRRLFRKDKFLKKLGSRAFYRVYMYFMDQKTDGDIANFSVISRRVVESLRAMREHNRTYRFLIQWAGFRTATVDVDHSERGEGKSSYTFGRLMKLAVDSIVSQSNKPLHMAIRLGFLITGGSLFFALYLIIRYFSAGIAVEGWTSLMVSIWLLSGLLVMNMGILGLYIGKVFDETKNRPLYLIRDSIGFSSGEGLIEDALPPRPLSLR